MIYAGIDAGSRAVKMVLLDGNGRRVLATGLRDQGVRQADIADALLDELLGGAGLAREDVKRVVATGYGRDAVRFADTTITEITCHGRGVRHATPEVRTVVDIGGQDSKLLRLDERGAVYDFVMNDRCAAGTGRFLEVVADRLGVSLGELGPLGRRATAPATISSMCVVFAETEIIGLLAAGESPENIVAGVQFSIASRIGAMAGRRIVPPVLFTGGVALIDGMTNRLADVLQQAVAVADQPQFTGALGAALLAAERD